MASQEQKREESDERSFMPSLTRGDFDTIDNDESRATGRALFLLAIQENHRDVLAALAAQPLVAYKDVEPRLIQENWIEEDLAAHFICRDKDTFIDGDLSHFRDLYEALQQWAKYYDLWVDWMIAQALDTLRVWSLPVVELVGLPAIRPKHAGRTACFPI
jgi:hypothetical protein